MTNEKKWIVFTNKETGKELNRLSFEDSDYGEIKSTGSLLAYENHIDESNVMIEFV